jgi:hypothetical protein
MRKAENRSVEVPKEIYTVDQEKSLTVGSSKGADRDFRISGELKYVEGRTSEVRSFEARVGMVGPDDVARGDMDLPRHATCHHLSW